MISVPVRLQPCARPQGTPVAGIVMGADPRRWRSVSDQLGPADDDLRVLPLPEGPGDRRCGGALLFSPALRPLPTVPGLLPYRIVGGRLLVPLNARLSVALEPGKMATLFYHPWQVWHPAIGLVGFDEEDLQPLERYYSLPESRRPVAWDRARPGLPSIPPPQRIQVADRADPGEVVERMRDDIGSGSPSELAPDSGDSGGLGGGLRRLLARLRRRVPWPHRLQPLLSRLPGGEQLGRHWERAAGDPAERTPMEMQRLLQLFREAPDEALRHAVPLSGEADHRGRTDARGIVQVRDPDFDLKLLGGGPSSGTWTVDARTFGALQGSYRNAASRELTLGRFGRAAYIYAHLLHDFHAAANALEQGGRHREAALLYERRLGSMRQAAASLAAGGLLLDAAERFAEAGDEEQAGDLFAQAGDAGRARAAYASALSRATSTLHRARLLVTKLERPEEALAELAKGWPEGPEAAACQAEEIRLRGEAADWGGVHRILRRISRGDGRLAAVREQVEVLRSVTATVREAETARWARDLAIGLTGEALQHAPAPAVREALLETLRALVPQDPQWAADVSAFRTRHAVVAPRPPRPVRPIELEPEDATVLRGMGDCHGTAAIHGGFLAWGTGTGPAGEGWWCWRQAWAGSPPETLWWERKGSRSRLLGRVHEGDGRLFLAPTGGAALSPRHLPASSHCPSPLEVATPAWWPGEPVLAMGEFDYRTLSIVRESQRSLLLSTYSAVGNLLREVPFGSGTIEPDLPCWLFTRGGVHFLFLGETAVAVTGEAASSQQVNFGVRVEAVAASPPHQRLRLVATTPAGTRLFFPRERWRALDLGRRQGGGPVCAEFLPNGTLVLVDGVAGTVFRASDEAPAIARFALPAGTGPPVAVIAGKGPNAPAFAVLTASGRLLGYPAVE